jgi:hypothetical protein
MRKPLLGSVPALAILTCSAVASAATYYASPTGTGNTCSQATPCGLGSGINKMAGGDTLLLADGTYSGASVPTYGFNITKSGTANAWTTIAAAPGALPVIVGAGPSNNTGLGASTGSYIQFIGIVVQKFNTGFANGWTGTGHVNDSNGNLRFINCIADGNGKNGIAFQSATGVLVRECIVAHNGGQADYASSGVDLFGAAGTYADNIVERNVSFENADIVDHSDGSGFIVDDVGTGATFVNNLGFRNGGSCIRLTQSTGTHIINNSCYADGMDTAAKNPASPGEIFFSSSVTQQGVLMVNNIAIATGTAQDQQAIFGAPSANVSNNYTKNDGTTSFWQDPAGTYPDYRLKATASDLIDKGTASNAPSNDVGFDPKCLTKSVPSVIGVQPWYQYSIDYEYIRSLGGVAGCFKTAARSGTPDIGAYEYSAVVGSGGSGGSGGAPIGGGAGAGGLGGAGGSGGASGGFGGFGGAGGAASGGAGGAASGAAGTAAGGVAGNGVGGASGAAAGGVAAGGVAAGGVAAGGAAAGGAAGAASGAGGVLSGGVGGLNGAGGAAGSSVSAGAGGSSAATGGTFAIAGMPALGGAPGSGMSGGAGGVGAGGIVSAGGSGVGLPDSPPIGPAGGEGCSCRTAGEPLRSAPLGTALTALLLGSLYRRRSRAGRRDRAR